MEGAQGADDERVVGLLTVVPAPHYQTYRRIEGGESGEDERVVGLLTVRLLQAYHEGAGGCLFVSRRCL